MTRDQNQNLQISTIQNSRVLVKVDYNLPNLDSIDRIQASRKTIQTLLENGNKVLLCSHWGRPKGLDKNWDFRQILPLIEQEFGFKPVFLDQYQNSFAKLRKTLDNSSSQLYLLQNTRFNSLEKSKKQEERREVAKNYALLVDCLVDEAFALSHRQEATNTEIKELLDWTYGLSFQDEFRNLKTLKESPAKPYVLIMGGAKVETKLPVIKSLIQKADKVLLGGLLAITFLQAARELGLSELDTAASKVYSEFLDETKDLLQKYSDKIVLPQDLVYAQEGDQKLALDIGEGTMNNFSKILDSARTVFWNGTLGKTEDSRFQKGTHKLAEKLVQISAEKSKVYIGGGDTLAAVSEKQKASYYFVSMGGGATLKFLEK